MRQHTMLVTELCDSNLEEYLAKVKLEAFKEENTITFLHQLGK